jgi:hypothetical protein
MQGEDSDEAMPSPAFAMNNGFVGAMRALYTRII